jgi:hypothetical protein
VVRSAHSLRGKSSAKEHVEDFIRVDVIFVKVEMLASMSAAT